MVDIDLLLPDLKKLVADLFEDLLIRCSDDKKVDAGLREAYSQIEKGGRTADVFEVWREDYLDQVAVAWVLGCVFVRFMEDNHLIDECWLAGEGERRKLSEDTHELYFRDHPHESDREYFEHVFREVGKIPACRDLFAEGKTPLWAVGPSGDASMKLLAFWRQPVPESGKLIRSFEVEDGTTRFLGDLYQDLSERARKKFALLQTPIFVEEFILDRTLDPAIDEFGLEEVRMIDPTCGSGHFLLGGFERLFTLWIKREGNEVVAAQKALDGVWGTDINPFAIAIARFRLITAALQACGINRLKDAPAWEVHLATGDSLLFGNRWSFDGSLKTEQTFLSSDDENWAPSIFACEDKEVVADVLGQQYHAVVGNPPYIIERDKSLNRAYRERYTSCHQKYSLVVPFTERFFDLAVAEGNGGFVAMICANSFMKREFGKKLIESFFPTIDLTHVIDTSVAFIPGHTTATLIMSGRKRRPQGESVRAVMGVKGEIATPKDPSQGQVWLSILDAIDNADFNNAFVSTADVPRSTFHKHPWSLGGGGTSELLEKLESVCATRVKDICTSIGYACFPGLDDPFVIDRKTLNRMGIDDARIKTYVNGEVIRNWMIAKNNSALTPYDDEFQLLDFDLSDPWARHLWRYRTSLENVKSFGQQTRKELGEKWWAWYRWIPKKLKQTPAIAYAKVATHFHGSLERGGHVFNGHTFLINLVLDSTENDYLALLAYLNSSTACFWMKQVMSCKGLGGQGGGIKPEPWSRAYEFGGTMMKKCPVPVNCDSLVPFSKQLDDLTVELQNYEPESVIRNGIEMLDSRLSDSRIKYEEINRKRAALQEELDWKVYALFDLCDDTTSPNEDVLGITPDERPVEILLKESILKGEQTIFYDVHSYRGTGKLSDAELPKPTRRVQDRLDVISKSSEIALLEQLDFKRRWQVEPWSKQLQRALFDWLLNRLESNLYWPTSSKEAPKLKSVSRIADEAKGDEDFIEVAAHFRGRDDFDVVSLIDELIRCESVPLLPCLCYKPSGERKRRVWETTWELQRSDDIGKQVGEIKAPPKYASSDFRKSDFWRLRGKFDVPKERWTSFPHCETEGDTSLVVGWAGWNHLQQATAIVAYYDGRKNAGWPPERLKPLLAAIDQLLPWIHQWHPEIDPDYNESAGASFQTLLNSELQELGLTIEDVRNWTPPKKTKKKKAAKRKTAKKKPTKKKKTAKS